MKALGLAAPTLRAGWVDELNSTVRHSQIISASAGLAVRPPAAVAIAFRQLFHASLDSCIGSTTSGRVYPIGSNIAPLYSSSKKTPIGSLFSDLFVGIASPLKVDYLFSSNRATSNTKQRILGCRTTGCLEVILE
jgi:hypothetical protein